MAENPMAGVSGPGPYAKRTDVGTPEMKMGSIAYGEGVETADIKSGAPLSKTPDAVSEPSDRLRKEQAPVTGLFAETQRPGEPITAGIDRGAGAGSSALQMNKITNKLSDTLAQMLPFDTTGEIAVLYQEALSRGN
jgi:hypothetical protein